MSDRAAFEAIKYALRQSKDGVVVSFVIHPNDVEPELMALPIGARVMVGWEEISDTEKPVASDPTTNTRDAVTALPAPEPPQVHKPKRHFGELLPSAQCAIRCTDHQFWKWIEHQVGGIVHVDEYVAADWVRGLCRIKSRSELNANAGARQIWENIEKDFKAWLLEDAYSPEARGAR